MRPMYDSSRVEYESLRQSIHKQAHHVKAPCRPF